MNATSTLAGICAAAAAALAAAPLCRAASHRPRPLPARGGVTIDRPPRRPRRSVVVAAVIAAGAVTIAIAGAGPAALVAAATVGAATARRRRARIAAAAAIEEAMPAAIELLVVCLHAGLTPTQALGELARDGPAPVRPAFAAVERRLHRGTGFADALAELTARTGASALALVTALSTAVRDGLPLAPVLDRLSDDAHARRRRAGEAAARRLPVRLSFPLVACTLPSFVLLSIAPAVLGALSSVRGSAP
jgi:tight adherence protein C